MLVGTKCQNNFQDYDVLRILKFAALFSMLNRWEKGRENLKHGKTYGLGSYSNMFLPLMGSLSHEKSKEIEVSVSISKIDVGKFFVFAFVILPSWFSTVKIE